jgi:YVTN family beta-propeller protein
MKHNRTLNAGLILTIAATAFLSSCRRDEPDDVSDPAAPAYTSGQGFFILNEGGFNAGNASMSYYYTSGSLAGTVVNDIYQSVNNAPLGDVANSISGINGRMYVVVNNSNRISVINPANMVVTATISGLSSPRYIHQISVTKAYVTEMGMNRISVINLNNNTVSGTIAMPYSTEAITMTNGKVYVGSQNSDKVYVIDPNTDAIIDSVTTAYGTNSMQVDANGKLWALSYGSWSASAAGGLHKINTTNDSVETAMAFTTSDFATHLCKNTAGDSLYFLNFNVYKMSVNDAALPSSSFISGAGHAFYTIGLLPNSSNFFVGDAVDYVQRGILYRYNGAGTQTDADTVGVIPNNFLAY